MKKKQKISKSKFLLWLEDSQRLFRPDIAERLGVNLYTYRAWLDGRAHLPLWALMLICYEFGLSLKDDRVIAAIKDQYSEEWVREFVKERYPNPVRIKYKKGAERFKTLPEWARKILTDHAKKERG